MMRRTETTPVPRCLIHIVYGLLFCLLTVGMVGCGGDGGGSSPVSSGPDKSADFGLILDPASKGVPVIPGQTAAITLDLVSSNGFAGPITLSAENVPTGWTTVFATPTIRSLPQGITQVVVHVTAPANTPLIAPFSAGRIKAVGGGMTRYLSSGDIHPTGEAGPPPAGQLLVTIGGN